MRLCVPLRSSINVTTNVLTVVDGPSAVSLSAATSIVEGGTASSSITFSLDKAAVGGTITLTPSGEAGRGRALPRRVLRVASASAAAAACSVQACEVVA